MLRSVGRVVHVTSTAELDRRLAGDPPALSTWRVVGIDLRGRGPELLRHEVAGATFAGCTFSPGDDDALAAAGALVLPPVHDVPLDPYRSTLYRPEELYDAPRYVDSLDARVYAWTQRRPGREDTLAAALHDHAIEEALTAWVARRRLVGVMGGHDWQRGTDAYADAVRLGRGLARDGELTVATGGGPGAMEAATVGARLAAVGDDVVDDVLGRLADAPAFRPSVDDWLAAADDVLRGPLAAVAPVPTLGIPTWFYGHEPATPFATAIAKYVGNAAREAVLLEVCHAGIVFLPGRGGTVQEVFQDGCENFYADPGSVAPMVLVGRAYWTRTLPVWPLLQRMAAGRPMEGHVHLVDDVDEAVDLVVGT